VLAGQRNYQEDRRPFLPHVTLARLKNFKTEDLPEIKETLEASFAVEDFQLIESELKRDGAEYRILESFSLSG
jgi:2'-5' RNA ligase